LNSFQNPKPIHSIDRKFGSQKARLDAIIDDIQNRKLSLHRYHELLYENLYDTKLKVYTILERF